MPLEIIQNPQCCNYERGLVIGVEKDGNAPWTELSEEELRVLYLVLTKPLLPDGSSAASEYETLRMVAEWAKGGAAWLRLSGK